MLVSNYHTCCCWWLLDMLATVAIVQTSFQFYSVVFYDAFYSLLPAVCCLLICSEIPITLLSGYLTIPHQGPKLWRLLDTLIRLWNFFPFSVWIFLEGVDWQQPMSGKWIFNLSVQVRQIGTFWEWPYNFIHTSRWCFRLDDIPVEHTGTLKLRLPKLP
jgi:hypothetical protein